MSQNFLPLLHQFKGKKDPVLVVRGPLVNFARRQNTSYSPWTPPREQSEDSPWGPQQRNIKRKTKLPISPKQHATDRLLRPGRKVLTHLGFHGDSKLCTCTNMRTHTYHRQTTTNHTCVPARIHTNIHTRRQAHTNVLGVLDGPHCFLSSALLNIGTRAFTHILLLPIAIAYCCCLFLFLGYCLLLLSIAYCLGLLLLPTI